MHRTGQSHRFLITRTAVSPETGLFRPDWLSSAERGPVSGGKTTRTDDIELLREKGALNNGCVDRCRIYIHTCTLLQSDVRAGTLSTVFPIPPHPCCQDQCMLSVTALLKASAHTPSLETWCPLESQCSSRGNSQEKLYPYSNSILHSFPCPSMQFPSILHCTQAVLFTATPSSRDAFTRYAEEFTRSKFC